MSVYTFYSLNHRPIQYIQGTAQNARRQHLHCCTSSSRGSCSRQTNLLDSGSEPRPPSALAYLGLLPTFNPSLQYKSEDSNKVGLTTAILVGVERESVSVVWGWRLWVGVSLGPNQPCRGRTQGAAASFQQFIRALQRLWVRGSDGDSTPQQIGGFSIIFPFHSYFLGCTFLKVIPSLKF